jgi:DNA polymerase-4
MARVKVFLHVDLDAFYASVEILDRPELKGRPVIVGALPGHRGVVSSCSYEARKFGVRSAMPISQAHRRCPTGVYLPVRMERYLECSQAVMGLLASYTPEFQQISVDEAFLDMSGTERLLGEPPEVGRKIKDRVLSETGLTLSIGIAPNKYLAKLASEFCKPDGLHRVPPGGELAFLDGLPLAKLWGVGEKTRQRLSELNITTIPALRQVPEDILCSMMGEASGRYLAAAVRGGDPGIYSLQPKSRSVSSETTFETDLKDAEAIKRTLLELAEQVMYRLMREGLKSNTVVLKLRTQDFTTTHAQRTVKHWLTSSDEIHRLAVGLLEQKWKGGTPIRLVGVGVDRVVGPAEAVQQELFDDELGRKRKVEEAVTRIREKIEGVTLTKASLLEGRGRRGKTKRG